MTWIRTFKTNKHLRFIFIVLALICCREVDAQTPVEQYGQLRVQGNRIVDKNGNPVQLRGMSLYWSQWKPAFYNASCIKWLRDDWCVSVVRAAMAVDVGGYATNPTAEKNKIITVIDACIANGIYVIVDFHVHEANLYATQATTFFNEISLKYKDVPNIIYETWNEPLQVSWANVIKPYHQNIVSVIRNNDPDNIIICGTANWSQAVGDPANSPVSGTNIAYTLHYYAASHKQWLRDAATAAMNKGIALFVTEYGTCAADGSGTLDATESQTWWDFLAANYIGHCNWSVADLGETSAALVTGTGATGNWPASALKPSGVLVRNYLKSKCVASNPIPTVSITAPAANANYCVGTAINITANASVSSGSISKVDFYDGNTLLGTDNSSPYAYSWTNATAGSKTIRAIATSAANAASSPATVTVVVNAMPSIPTVVSPVNYCQGVTASTLLATGTGLKWYGTNATGGTSSTNAPIPSTNTVGATTYYVSQTVNACESPRAAIVVNIGAPTTAPTVASPKVYCQGATATALTANGSNLLWYTSQTGGTGSATAPMPPTNAVGTTTYYVSQTGNGCESARTALDVMINASPSAPSVSSPVNYDLNQQATSLTASGTNLKWYISATGGAGSSTVPIPLTSSLGVTTHYVSQTGVNGCESPRAAIVINVTNTYKIYRVNTVPVIDGSIDGIWNHSNIKQAILTNAISGTVSNSTDLSGTFKALWDNNYLYVLGEITDETKTNDSPEIYNDDAVEVYVDINNDKANIYGNNDAQYTFGWNDGVAISAQPAGRLTTGINYSMVSTGNGYVFEARIPWANIQGNPVVGQLLGIEFQVNDDDNGTARDGKLTWTAATDDAWQNPSLFGVGIFSDIITAYAEEVLRNEVSIYPNPFGTETMISVNGEFEYELYNSLGMKLTSGKSLDNTIVGLGLHSGIYFVKIMQGDQHKSIKITKR